MTSAYKKFTASISSKVNAVEKKIMQNKEVPNRMFIKPNFSKKLHLQYLLDRINTSLQNLNKVNQ